MKARTSVANKAGTSKLPAGSRHGTPGAAVDDAGYLSSKQAAQLLRIKPQTLYAYVSRGWIHSIGRDKRRGYLYLRDDVERLRARGHARAEGSPYKAGSPRWSERDRADDHHSITPPRPHPVACTFGDRARLASATASRVFRSCSGPVSGRRINSLCNGGLRLPRWTVWSTRQASAAAASTSSKMFSLYMMALASRSTGGDDLRDGNTVVAARTLLTGLPGCLGYLSGAAAYALPDAGGGPASALAPRILASAGLAVTQKSTTALNAALVVLADHELTPQTFAARLAASSGASLYFCILSALGAHSGSRIRRACDKVEDLLVGQPGGSLPTAGSAEIGRALSVIPGFNHPLYPNGDPRAEYLRDLARSAAAGSNEVGALLETATGELGTRPSVEAGLVALCHALKLPYRSAGAILTISRCSGWIAHVIEQRLAGMMLRPRARYLAAR